MENNYQTFEEGVIEKIKSLLDDPIRGLKESSDTNKTRYGIFAEIENALHQQRGNMEKERYWSPCVGCKDGHPSFWKTIVESAEWTEWEKEQRKRFRTEEKIGCYDIDECRGCGWISPSHFKEFLDFISKEKVTSEREMMGKGVKELPVYTKAFSPELQLININDVLSLLSDKETKL